MNSESSDEEVFQEYKELGPQKTSHEQYAIAFLHVIAGFTLFAVQIPEGLAVWFAEFGILTPILLIVQGFVYALLKNPQWLREQMIPYFLELFMVTEIEADQFVGYHRWLNRYLLLLGFVAIAICQFVWTYGLTVIVPLFPRANFFSMVASDIITYAVIFGPFLLYVGLMFAFYGVLESLLQSINEDILHLFDIERRWSKEHSRRETIRRTGLKSGEDPSDSWH
ncbi:MAG: hypothetical protein ACW98J_06665 [Candidatus Thorarchaeota archaeon]|jgi:hypothetical protein